MKFASSLSLLLCLTTLSHANYESNIDAKIRSPLLGLWKLSESPAQCTEYYNFREWNSLVVKSGQEWVVGQYSYQYPEYHDQTQPVLLWEIKYDNNQVDCHGQQIDQSGDVVAFKVNWKNENEVQLCDSQSNDCYIHLERISP